MFVSWRKGSSGGADDWFKTALSQLFHEMYQIHVSTTLYWFVLLQLK